MAHQPNRRVYHAYEVENVRVRRLGTDFSQGYPTGAALFYECLNCGDFVPSFPVESLACGCGNIAIDIDAGRLSAHDDQRIRLVEIQGA